MSVRGLGDPGPPIGAAKIDALAELARAGLPVPAGVVIEPGPPSPEARAAVAALLAEGAVIVRSAIAGEDEPSASAAGLGISVADCGDLEAVTAALGRIATVGAIAVLVQHQVPLGRLVVAAAEPEAPIYVELHRRAGALERGDDPEYRGPLEAWDHPRARALAEVIARALRVLGPSRFGHDLELVLAPDGRPFVVQARPIVRPLSSGFAEFAAAVAREGNTIPADREPWTWDAEHNPAPLSPAHASLLDRLRRARPGRAGDPIALAGYLYVRTLPGGLGRTVAKDPRATLDRLRTEWLPAARERAEALALAADAAEGPALARVLERALDGFFAMIDLYLGELAPARRAAGGPQRADPRRLDTLRGRAAFVDVLPVHWDLASPTLGELGPIEAELPPLAASDLPDTPAAAATSLGEWDDHLFALGLAPLRAVYLRAATVLDLPRELVFMARLEELEAALATAVAPDPDRLRRRLAEMEAHARLRPPLRIFAGRPVPEPSSRRLRGVPIGPSFRGPIAQRLDLADLHRRPPGAEAIVVLPNLTSHAALVLHATGVRAVCCEHGGALSHAALMARELELSALIGCRGCTEIADGVIAELDTRVGRLRPLAG